MEMNTQPIAFDDLRRHAVFVSIQPTRTPLAMTDPYRNHHPVTIASPSSARHLQILLPRALLLVSPSAGRPHSIRIDHQDGGGDNFVGFVRRVVGTQFSLAPSPPVIDTSRRLQRFKLISEAMAQEENSGLSRICVPAT